MKFLSTLFITISIILCHPLSAQDQTINYLQANYIDADAVDAHTYRVMDPNKQNFSYILNSTEGYSFSAPGPDLTFTSNRGTYFILGYNRLRNRKNNPGSFGILNSYSATKSYQDFLFKVDGDRKGVAINHHNAYATLLVNHRGSSPSSSFRNGLTIRNHDTDQSKNDWTIHTSYDGDLKLYFETYRRGIFDRYSGHYVPSSDVRYKRNIKDLEDGQLKNIMAINPTTYELNDLQEGNGRKVYGLIAQELQEVYPDIVLSIDEDSIGTRLAVSYTELIPILIKGIQEQQGQIEILKQELKNLRTQLQEEHTDIQGFNPIQLDQNAPNPANGQTSIKYQINRTFKTAELRITNATGQLLKTLELGTKSFGSIAIQTDNLPAGTYQYTILVDGQIMQTKSMIVQ